MVELIAEYSPPIPAPVRNRKNAKLAILQENAVAAVAVRYTASVRKKRFLRPNRSVNQPKKIAPNTAPARYALLASPISVFEKRSDGLSFSAPAMLPASVTSRPSKI